MIVVGFVYGTLNTLVFSRQLQEVTRETTLILCIIQMACLVWSSRHQPPRNAETSSAVESNARPFPKGSLQRRSDVCALAAIILQQPLSVRELIARLVEGWESHHSVTRVTGSRVELAVAVATLADMEEFRNRCPSSVGALLELSSQKMFELQQSMPWETSPYNSRSQRRIDIEIRAITPKARLSAYADLLSQAVKLGRATELEQSSDSLAEVHRLLQWLQQLQPSARDEFRGSLVSASLASVLQSIERVELCGQAFPWTSTSSGVRTATTALLMRVLLLVRTPTFVFPWASEYLTLIRDQVLSDVQTFTADLRNELRSMPSGAFELLKEAVSFRIPPDSSPTTGSSFAPNRMKLSLRGARR